MAKFVPTEAVFAGFRFAKERPAVILIWSAYMLVVLAVALVAMFDIGGDAMTSLAIATQGANPDRAQLLKLFEAAAPGFMFANLLLTVFGAVLSTAILRLRLKPGPQPWAGLRLGGDELRLLAVAMLAQLIMLAFEMVVVSAASLLPGAVNVLVRMAGFLLILAVMVRLSLAGVVSQTEGRIDLGRSLRLTRKGFWPLLGAYVLLGGIALVAFFLMTIMFAFLTGAATVAMGGTVSSLALALQGNFSQLNPVLVLLEVASDLAAVWLLVVVLCVFNSIGVDAYRAFSEDLPRLP